MKKPLWLGALVPIVYFGIQPIAAQFYPHYDFVTQSASELGSDRSERPSVLNTGAILTGILTLIAASAFPAALRRRNCPPVVAWITTLALVSMGIGAIWAGIFHLPDPRHNPRAIGAGAFLLPILLPLAVWRIEGARWLKVYLLANVALFVAMAAVMSGAAGIDVAPFRGALQRMAAAVLYLPVGVVSVVLRRALPLSSALSSPA